MLLWKLYKESYQKDCELLQIVPTLGKFVHSANLSSSNSTKTTETQYHLKILQTQDSYKLWRMWSPSIE